MQQQKRQKTEHGFKQLILNSGYSPKAAEELWKWYDSSAMKGVASF